jgi:hypothetical protein
VPVARRPQSHPRRRTDLVNSANPGTALSRPFFCFRVQIGLSKPGPAGNVQPVSRLLFFDSIADTD